MTTKIDVDELVKHYRECIAECYSTLDKLTFIHQRRENLHICKKDCVGSAIRKTVFLKPFIVRASAPCIVKCMFQWLRHNNRDVFQRCVDRCIPT